MMPKNYDVDKEGKRIRHDKAIAPDGVNVNFVEQQSDSYLNVRTYERGVEAETWSCGTGVVAAALAFAEEEKISSPVRLKVMGGELGVSYEGGSGSYSNIYLMGPAVKAFEGEWKWQELN